MSQPYLQTGMPLRQTQWWMVPPWRSCRLRLPLLLLLWCQRDTNSICYWKGAEWGSGWETHSRLAEVDVDLHELKGFLLKRLSGFRRLASFIGEQSNSGRFWLMSRGGPFILRADNAPRLVKNLAFHGRKYKCTQGKTVVRTCWLVFQRNVDLCLWRLT